MLSNLEILASQVTTPLARLRAALQRCGSCVDVVTSCPDEAFYVLISRSAFGGTLTALLMSFDQDGLGAADEAMALLQRLALLSLGEAERLAPHVARIKSSHAAWPPAAPSEGPQIHRANLHYRTA